MARGRFLSKSIATSSKLATVSSDAARLYFHCLPHHDRDYLINGDPAEMLDEYVPAIALRNGWRPLTLGALIQELLSAGLWIRHTCKRTGRPVFEIVGAGRHQILNYKRESPSRWCVNAGPRGPRTPATVKTDAAQVEEEGEVEGEGEVKGAGVGTAPMSSKEDTPSVLGIWREIWEDDRGKVPPVSPLDRHVVEKAEEMGTFARWTKRKALKSEVVRTMEGMEARGLDVTLRGVVNHLGESWGARSTKGADAPAHKPYDAAARRRELAEIRKED